MIIKKSIAAVSAVALLAVGYLGGAYIGLPDTDKEAISGNIGKAKVFDEEDPDIAALQSALQTDSTMQQKAVLSAVMLSSKINDINDIVDASIKGTEGVKSLADANKAMKALVKKAANAKDAQTEYLDATGKLIAGEKVKDYEDICNKALLSYTILANKLSSYQNYVDLFAEYLEEGDNAELKKAFSLWMGYCVEDAVLQNNTKEAMKFWKSTTSTGDGNMPTISTSVDKAIEACKKQTKDENIIRILAQLNGKKVETANPEIPIMKQCEQMLASGK